MPDAHDGRSALLLIAASEQDANLYYASRFLAPDPFIFLQIDGRRVLIMSDLEVDRARSQARVDEVLSYSRLNAAARARRATEPGMADVIDQLCQERGVTRLEVPSNFGLAYAERLRALGYALAVRPEPLFPERLVKTAQEIEMIIQTQRATEAAVASAIELIRQSEIRDGHLFLGGKPLTAELVKKVINLHLMEHECVAQHTIVACGRQACDPHNEGAGPLAAHEAIVLDVFPQHAGTRYYADMTRTVVRGQAAPKLKRMYELVREGQEIGFRMIKPGVDGAAVHQAILDLFDKHNFKTGEQDGRMQGFFHGTGHGLGLEVHEAPRVSARPDVLQEGMVVTVEPGLYYLDAGGVRLEDLVVVTKDGCRNLTEMPKVLEV